jgi:hypothetical protein
MQFLKAAFFFAAVAAASAHVVRDVPTLLSDLETASADITSLQNSIDDFDGTLASAIVCAMFLLYVQL